MIIRRMMAVPAAVLAMSPLAGDAIGQETVATQVLVRVLAHDAKLIGTGMGGVRVTVREADSGEILTEGVHEGGTGSTELIMDEPHVRGRPIYNTEGAAGYVATLDLARPTRVEIAAEGPLGIPDAMQRATKTLLVVPGEHLTGQGVVLELNGFAIEIQDPAADQEVGGAFDVRVRIRMLCGCPIEPGGRWDADRITVVARLVDVEGVIAAETPLAFGGETSIFVGKLEAPRAGGFELEVLASDAERANFGRAGRTVTLVER